jgi:hypothetical protein
MLNRKFRRVLIGESALVTEKEILEYLFRKSIQEPTQLSSLMNRRVAEVNYVSVPRIDDGAGLGEAAKVLSNSKRRCALSSSGIVTPWDLIMKPWRLGRLTISR